MPLELISIVLPAFNEEQNVNVIHREIRQATAGTGVDAELIFVDDGSRDATAERVRALAESDPLVRLVRLSRNFGHQAALLAGLKAARGAAVVTMDSDLQHPPALLPSMIATWRAGAMIVQMNRIQTQGASWMKAFSSAVYYRLMKALSDYPVVLGPDFQLLDRQVVTFILGLQESRPFVRGNVAWAGFPCSRIDFVAQYRHAGTSQFSLVKMIRMALDGITALSTKPLRVAIAIGFLLTPLCLIYAVFAISSYARGIAVPGWASIIVSLLFLGAVQLITVGILGEYVGRIYELTRRLPPYVIYEEQSSKDTSDREESRTAVARDVP